MKTAKLIRNRAKRIPSWPGVVKHSNKAVYIRADLTRYSHFSLATKRRTIHTENATLQAFSDYFRLGGDTPGILFCMLRHDFNNSTLGFIHNWWALAWAHVWLHRNTVCIHYVELGICSPAFL